MTTSITRRAKRIVALSGYSRLPRRYMVKTMEAERSVLINKLPRGFTKEIHDHQRRFSITMLIYDDGATDVIPCSGTLAQLGGQKGIVTARHVWNKAKEHQLLLTLIGHGNYAFERKHLVGLVPEFETVLSEFEKVRVPDIAFIKLPYNYVGDLEAKGKAFFNIDKRIEAGAYLPELEQGYWSVFGNPDEWRETGKKKVISFVYGTGLSRCLERDNWDYLVMRLDTSANPDIPRDFSGMSGGGIWWTRWTCDESLQRFVVENPSRDILLAGVSFFQTGNHDRMLLGHGPKSIYELLYQVVCKSI